MYGLGLGIISAISFVANMFWYVRTEKKLESLEADLHQLQLKIAELQKDQNLCQNYIILENTSE